MIKITKEDATALRYSNGELPKEVLVGEYEVTTITPTGQVRKADIYGKDFSSDYYDLIIDESVKTIGRKHTYVKIAIVLVLLFSALFCHSQVRDSAVFKLPIQYYGKTSTDFITKDTCIGLVCSMDPGSIAHTRVIVIEVVNNWRTKVFDLKGKLLDRYFVLSCATLTEDQRKKIRNAN